VIAVDCDLRRPRLHDFFDLSNEVGFTSVVLGLAPLSDVVQAVPGHANRRVVASGPGRRYGLPRTDPALALDLLG